MRTFGAIATLCGGLLAILGLLFLVTNFLPPDTSTIIVGVGIVGIVAGQLFMKAGEEY